jgi:mono/diheme cytochrome c family protein
VITVTAGKPSEFKFTLSKSSKIAVGPVSFKVTNKGKLTHDFKVCTAPAKTSKANSCTGKVTPMLAPGKSATLTVTLKSGTFEFLCTVPGHAIVGMKGLVGIGAAVTVTNPVTTTVAGTTTTGSTTTTSTTPVSYPPGNATNGKTIFTGPGGCGGCHALAAAGTPAGDGPALDGTNLSVAAVEAQVAQGGAGMPGYTGVLTTQQIADVSTFVSQNST